MSVNMYNIYFKMLQIMWVDKLITDEEHATIRDRLNERYLSELPKDETTTIDC